MKIINMVLFIFALIFSSWASGQQGLAGNYLRLYPTTLPTICHAGDIRFNVGANSLSVCYPANTWAAIGGGGGSTSLTQYSILGNNTALTATGTANQSFILGTPGYAATSPAYQVTSTLAGPYNSILQNLSANAGASTSYMVGNNNGTASTNLGAFGINSSAFSGTGSLNLPSATFLYSKSGDLSLGTASANAIHFNINNGASDALTVNTSGQLVFPAFSTAGVLLNSASGVVSSSAGPLSIASGGTGAASTSQNFAFIGPTSGSGAPTFRALVAGDVPTLNQNTTGTSSNVTGTVAIGNGGTGQTTAPLAINALLPSQAAQSGNVLGTNGTVAAWVASSGSPPVTTKGDLYTYSTVGARLPVGSDYQSLISDASATTGNRWATNWKGVKNYIQYSDFENAATTGWSLGTTGTLTNGIPTGTPTFGSGSTGIVITATGGALAGVDSLQFAQTGASTAGNMLSTPGAGIAIDAEDQAKVLTFRFYYRVSSGAANINMSGTSANSYGVAFYDTSNSVWLTSTANFSMTQISGVGVATGTVQTGASTASLAMVVYNANATAGSATLIFDDFYLGPQTAPVGAAVTDWVAYIPTITGFGTPTAVSFFSRRVGGNLEVKGTFTAGTTTSTISQISLGFQGGNSNVTVDTSKTPPSSVCGVAGNNAASATYFGAYVLIPSSNQAFVNLSVQTSTLNANTAIAANAFLTASITTVHFTVPIVGWQSNVQMSNDTDTRVVAASAHVSSGAATTNGVAYNFDTVDYDTHGAITTGVGTWSFKTPVSGYYRASMGIATGGAVSNYAVYKNASLYRLLASTSSTIGASYGSVEVNLVAGDTIDFRPTVTTTPVASAGATIGQSNWITIERLSGPSVVAATEAVNFRYFSTVTTITGSLATIVYTTKGFDSHNAFGAGTGIFTAPVSGKYECNTAIGMTGTFALNSLLDLQIQQTGSSSQISESKIYAGAAVTQMAASVSDIFSLIPGDTIKVQASNSGTSPVIAATTSQNFLSCLRVGN